jgi:beta-lactamase superfamily II metal-dependent hydrolase
VEQPPRKLAILDVGHGNCTVLQDTKGVTVIDAGPRSHLLEYLTQQGIRRIESILVSHADEDHIGGLIALLDPQTLEVGKIRLNTDPKPTKAWHGLLHILDRADRHGNIDFQPFLTLSSPENSGEFDQGSVQVQVLGPSKNLAARGPGGHDGKGRKIESNSISAVIRLSIDDEPIALLPGDLDEIGLDDLLESHEDIHAPLVVFPHHGGRSRRTSSAEFAKRLCRHVRPETVIFSIGRGRFGTPRPEVVEAVRQANTRVRIACTQLSERCAAKTPNFDASHLNPEFSGGREFRTCCAGTLVLDLDNPRSVLPAHEEHLEFIRRAAPLALCQ